MQDTDTPADKDHWRRYAGLNDRDLQKRLVEDEWPTQMRTAIKNQVIADRRQRRSDKIKATMQDRQWVNIRLPLNAEVLRVKASLAYKGNPSPARHAAFTAYLELLLQLRSWLANLQRPDGDSGERHSPGQVVKLFAEKDKHIPNDGIHWEDWVKPKDKRRIYEMFNALHDEKKLRAKVKEPFERWVTPRQFMKQKLEFETTLTSLVHTYTTEWNITKTYKSYDKLAQVQEALRCLAVWPLNRPLPRDWRKLPEMGEGRPGTGSEA
jgi:hypothetical protein